MNAAPGDAGLCGNCRYARRIRSGRGSLFLLCRRSASDPRFARYPALPVRVCAGFEALDQDHQEKPNETAVDLGAGLPSARSNTRR